MSSVGEGYGIFGWRHRGLRKISTVNV